MRAQGCVRATVSLAADSPSKSSDHAQLSSSSEAVYSACSQCSSSAHAAQLRSPFSAVCSPPLSAALASDNEDAGSQRSCSGRHYSRCGAERPRNDDHRRAGDNGDTWSQASCSRRQEGSCGAERPRLRNGDPWHAGEDADAWSQPSCSSRRRGGGAERVRLRRGDPWRAGEDDDAWSQPSCSSRRHGRCGAECPRSQNDTTRRATCWDEAPGASRIRSGGGGGGSGEGKAAAAAAQRVPPRPSCDYTRLQVLRNALHRASQEGRSPGCGARPY